MMQPGTHLGPYEILSRIGVGGMEEVWRARDTRLGRDVAVKILPDEIAQDAKLKIRFEHEARTVSLLTHPNICTLFDVGENYLVMELLEGETLLPAGNTRRRYRQVRFPQRHAFAASAYPARPFPLPFFRAS